MSTGVENTFVSLRDSSTLEPMVPVTAKKKRQNSQPTPRLRAHRGPRQRDMPGLYPSQDSAQPTSTFGPRLINRGLGPTPRIALTAGKKIVSPIFSTRRKGQGETWQPTSKNEVVVDFSSVENSVGRLVDAVVKDIANGLTSSGFTVHRTSSF